MKMYVIYTAHKLMPQTRHLHRRAWKKTKDILRGFTLIELLIVIAIMGILASGVMYALNPFKNRADALDAVRKRYARELESAMVQRLIDKQEFLNNAQIPSGAENAKQICRFGVSTDPTCVNLDALIPQYLAALPTDGAEGNLNYTGYKIYKDSSFIKVIPAYEGFEAGGGSSSAAGGNPILVHRLTGGPFHTCGLTTAGTVFCWGAGWSGELGDGGNAQVNTPVQVLGVGGAGFLTSVAAVYAAGHTGNGWGHTCAILTSKKVACWGANARGQLGNGSTTDSSTPVMVVGVGGTGELGDVVALAMGGNSTCAALDDGEVVCWGSNSSGQLGDGTTTNRLTPTPVVGVGGTGVLDNVQSLAGGWDHTCAVFTDGRMACWGSNRYGSLGLNVAGNATYTTPQMVLGVGAVGELGTVEEASASYYSTCARMTSGEVTCWGNNWYGQVGDGTTSDRATPVYVRNATDTANLTGITQISINSDNLSDGVSCALQADSQVSCWGALQVSVPHELPELVPGIGGVGTLSDVAFLNVGPGGATSCVVLSNNTAACWGNGEYGKLGDGTTPFWRDEPGLTTPFP